MNISDGLIGWSVGYQYAILKNKEDEIKQGKNYYLSALVQSSQVSILMDAVSKINELMAEPSARLVPYTANILSILAIPSTLFCAMVKHGHYDAFAKTANEKMKDTPYAAYFTLPEKLGERTVKVCCFFAEYGGDIARVAMVVSAVSIIALGSPAYGSAVLVSVAYEAIDSRGYVPRKVSLFMEKYMPTVTLIGLFIGGTPVSRVFTAIHFATHLFPEANYLLQHKVDQYVGKLYFDFLNSAAPMNGLKRIEIADFEAPVIEKRNMSYTEIVNILNHGQKAMVWNDLKRQYEEQFTGFEINPAHCSKFAFPIAELQEDENFEDYHNLFNAIDWESKYNFVKRKLADDDIFIDLVLENYPEITKETAKKNYEHYIELLAAKENKTPAKFASDWAKEQMGLLVQVLLGNKRVKGSQQELDDAMKDLKKILFYLKHLDNTVEYEDTLLKIAIEAGNYCARGIKGTTNEIMRGILQNCTNNLNIEIDDPDALYELQVKQTLQNIRLMSVESTYKEMVDMITKGSMEAVTQDKHAFDIYRFILALGIYPLTKFERDNIGAYKIIMCSHPGWVLMRGMVLDAYKAQINDAITQNGELRFSGYMQRMINANPKLTEDQKEKIIEMYAMQNEDENGNSLWTPEETEIRFHNLLLYQLGILRKAQAA